MLSSNGRSCRKIASGGADGSTSGGIVSRHMGQRRPFVHSSASKMHGRQNRRWHWHGSKAGWDSIFAQMGQFALGRTSYRRALIRKKKSHSERATGGAIGIGAFHPQFWHQVHNVGRTLRAGVAQSLIGIVQAGNLLLTCSV